MSLGDKSPQVARLKTWADPVTKDDADDGAFFCHTLLS